MDQNCLIALTAIMGFIGVPVGILFRALLQNQAQQIADLKALLDRSMGVNEGQAAVSQDLVKKAVPPRRAR